MKFHYSIDEELSMQDQEKLDLLTQMYFHKERHDFYYGAYNALIPCYQMQLEALNEIAECLSNNVEIDIAWLRDVVNRGLYWETHRDELNECLRESARRIANS
jgi:hypothetical protein